ncbi:MAG: EVE domain-containing protein [Bacteroidia bacterium]|nr:EVE domain-containing protein [Bacteroidia bacterium]MDW8015259.1 EVE domain-containing protein [Bacteroidia bacterium]
MPYWLVKSEPEEYSFTDLLRDKRAIWDGVRNPQAQAYLRQMQIGDFILYYHSGKERAIVGLAKVSRAAFPEPTDSRYVAVEIEAVSPFVHKITLAAIRAAKEFDETPLLRQPRLSVMPVSIELWEWIMRHSSSEKEKLE